VYLYIVLKMKFNFNIAAAGLSFVLLSAAACRPSGPPGGAPAPIDGSDVQRLVAVLDYLAGDYPRAVENGQPVSASEYEEQLHFAQDAQGLTLAVLRSRERTVDPAQDPVTHAVDEIAALVAAKADGAAVAARCQSLKSVVAERFGLRTAPTGRPDRTRAEMLYVQSCTICHGPRGNADTDRARQLAPHPANFHDPEVQAKLSPYRAYNALTFGVSGTSMPSFEALSPEDRWSLAFFVLSLGHRDDAPAVPASMTLADLAWLSDGDVLAELRREHHPAPPRGLTYLRATAPFEEPTVAAGIGETRSRLRRAVAAYVAEDAVGADRLVLDAYLQGFEPLEPRLRARDPQGTAGIEKAFQALRTAMRGEMRDLAAVRAAAGDVEARLAHLERPRETFFPFVAALLIYLREGAEAALLVGALLAAVRKLGQSGAARPIHHGWIAALPAGVATWWAFERLLAQGAAERELIEAGTALVAAAVLFWVSFWLISKAESRRWAAYLKKNVAGSVARRNHLVLFAMSFLAVYREAAETVLFTQALLLESGGERAQVWAGAVAGLAAVVLLALAMRRAVLSLPIGPFFAVSSVLLCLLSVSFAGAGLNTLISAGYLAPRPVPFPEMTWIGVYADLSALLVQAAIVTVILVAGLHTFLSAKRATPGGDGGLAPAAPKHS
jgi:high-affinity iron transporter